MSHRNHETTPQKFGEAVHESEPNIRIKSLSADLKSQNYSSDSIYLRSYQERDDCSENSGEVPTKRKSVESDFSASLKRKEKIKKIPMREYDQLLKNNNLFVEEIAELKEEMKRKVSELQELRSQYNKHKLDWQLTTGLNPGVRPAGLQAACACAAAARADIDALDKMLKHGTDIHAANYDKRTALHVAAAEGHKETVKYLLKAGAQVAEDRHGLTPLIEAINNKHAVIAYKIHKNSTLTEKKKIENLITSADYVLPTMERGYSTQLRAMAWLRKSKSTDKPIIIIEEIRPSPEPKSPLTFSTQTKRKDKDKDKEKDKEKEKEKEKEKNKKLTDIYHRLFGKKTKQEAELNLNSIPEGIKFGVAFGTMRGECKVINCNCECFSGNESSACSCSHWAVSHKDLGLAPPTEQETNTEAAELISPREEEEVEDLNVEPLIKKKPNQSEEWPKVLNHKFNPYYTGVEDIQKHLSVPEWSISPDDLEFSSELGRGTAAQVYKGSYKDRTVAIKVMEFSLVGRNKEKQKQDLKEEFGIMKQLNSEHVVRLFGIVVEPRICMVLELCGKGSLYDILREESFLLDWSLFFKYFEETVKGIQVLHNWKPAIVHRDIKSLNLLVSDDNTVKVADFGLSRFLESTDRPSTLMKLRGTYCYSAPEVYTGSPYTIKSDIYSLSIVLWELVTKCVSGAYSKPYSEYTFITLDFQVIIQVAKKKLRPTISTKCPDSLQELITRMWDEKPEVRPDCSELLENFDKIQKEYEENTDEWDNIIAKPPPPEEPLLISTDDEEKTTGREKTRLRSRSYSQSGIGDEATSEGLGDLGNSSLILASVKNYRDGAINNSEKKKKPNQTPNHKRYESSDLSIRKSKPKLVETKANHDLSKMVVILQSPKGTVPPKKKSEEEAAVVSQSRKSSKKS